MGPRQNRHAKAAREGLLDGFTARLVELESRRWLFFAFAFASASALAFNLFYNFTHLLLAIF